jgi:hypothetical protein
MAIFVPFLNFSISLKLCKEKNYYPPPSHKKKIELKDLPKTIPISELPELKSPGMPFLGFLYSTKK